MKRTYLKPVLAGLVALAALAASSGCTCDRAQEKGEAPQTSAEPVNAPQPKYDSIDRKTFNRIAIQMDLPLFWIEDKNNNGAVDPDELASLLFYSTMGRWFDGGQFSADFQTTYGRMTEWAKSPTFPDDISEAEKKRRLLMIEELDQGQPTLVFTDFSKNTPEEHALVRHMLMIAKYIDDLHSAQRGLPPLAAKIAKDDPMSQAVFRRNWGPKCDAPKTVKNPDCTAVAGVTGKVAVNMYPSDLQNEEGFCDKLVQEKNGEELMSPFVVVRRAGAMFLPTPVVDAFKPISEKVSKELLEAATTLDNGEAEFRAYLRAAARAFVDNNWELADESWAKLNATNSKWYLRVGPDEVYWDPCNRKAGFHMSFARINQASLEWQAKLEPVKQEMEDNFAKQIGNPYKARKVTFHLPDFIDIVLNAGDSRHPLGATIGQSLPNWGPVANEGRGRTVVMSNLYTDPDSVLVRKEQAQSMFDAATEAKRSKEQEPSLLSTILHEATHNFGPAHEYKIGGKTGAQIFGGAMASVLEEMKAQTGALWYIDMLKQKGIIDATLAEQTYIDSFFWALNHIARGMYSDDGKPRTYSHVAAMQVGFLMDEGAATFDPEAMAANGKDKGAFTLHFDKFPAVAAKLMTVIGALKAKGDKAMAEHLVKKYVDGKVVPMEIIAERSLRHPKAAFVYGLAWHSRS